MNVCVMDSPELKELYNSVKETGESYESIKNLVNVWQLRKFNRNKNFDFTELPTKQDIENLLKERDVPNIDSTFMQEYTQEMKDILANAPRDEQGRLLAPNGKPSNLTERQYAQVRTKAFKEWFGDWENDPANASKVVDENGEPLVVYHGSVRQFNIFKTDKIGSMSGDKSGFYFTNKRQIAKDYYSKETGTFLGNLKLFFHISNEYKSSVYDTFLNSRNPYVTTISNDNEYWNREQIINDAKEKGYDSVLFKDVIDGPTVRQDVRIVFNPNQIKSATDNIGTFDANNPDIRYRKVPSIAELRAQEKSAYDRFNNDVEAYYRKVRDIIKEVNYRRFNTEREAMKAFNESGIRKDFFYRITREGANNAAGYKIQLLTRDMVEQYKQDNNPYSDEYKDYTTPIENFYFDSLGPEIQMMLFDKGWTKEQFDSISQQERDQAVKCIAL